MLPPMALRTPLHPPGDAPATADRRDRLDTEKPSRVPRLAPERPLRAAAGLLVVIGCAAVGTVLTGNASRREAVLEVARAIPAGVTLRTNDLETVDLVPARGLPVLPATSIGRVVGQAARVPLVAGTLLVPADLGVAPRLPPGSALVGTSLAPDAVPSGLAPGDEVLVVPTGGSQQTGALGVASATGGVLARPPVLAQGIVVAVAQPGSTSPTGDELVTLAVPRALAPEVAAASAAGNVSLAELVLGVPR